MLAIMNTESGYSDRKNGQLRPRALDPDFPILAAAAAAELDGLLTLPVDNPDLSAVGELGQLLVATNDLQQAHVGKFSLWDPVSDGVFVRAVTDANIQQGNLSAESLQKSLKDVGAYFSKLKADPAQVGKDKEQIKKARGFCLALSNYSASKREAAFGSSSRNPNRK